MVSTIKSADDRLAALRIVQAELRKIAFPKLERPEAPISEPTIDLLNWAGKLYCFSMLSHFRELLNSFVLLVDEKHIPAVFIITRTLYEVGAHTYYVQKHVKQYRAAGSVKEEWKFMESINMGSLYMMEKKLDEKQPFSAPREIGKIIRSFGEWPDGKHKAHVHDAYSYLSEFTHPNMAALSHYYTLERDPVRKRSIATFINPQLETIPLPDACVASGATLSNLQDLFWLIEEKEIGAQVSAIATSLISNQSKSLS